MAEESFQERTEEATPRKREEAREKGQVPKSRELTSVAVLLAGLLTLFWGSAYFYEGMADVFRHYLTNAGTTQLSTDSVQGLALLATRQFSVIVAPLFIILFAISVVANYLQVGSVFSSEAIMPKFSKINPIEGFKRIFSAQAMMELFKSLFKIVVVGWISYATIKGEMDHLLPLLDQTPSQIMTYLGGVSFTLFWRTCLVMIVLSVLDFLFQRWEHERNLRMTKQEVKEEYKKSEGDPQVRSRIRSIQREMARKRMMAAVPEADVVITNPTHLAVALKYDVTQMEAPKVIAKGAGAIAEKIKAKAKEHSIPIVENKPLAQSLFKMVEVGKSIPEDLYQAVAEVLAYVYRLRGKTHRTVSNGGRS